MTSKLERDFFIALGILPKTAHEVCEEGDCPIEAEFYTECITCYENEDKVYYPIIRESQMLMMHFMALMMYKYLTTLNYPFDVEYIKEVDKIKTRYMNVQTYTEASREFVLNHFIKYYPLVKDTFIDEMMRTLFKDPHTVEGL
jgi:hypothetical protein